MTNLDNYLQEIGKQEKRNVDVIKVEKNQRVEIIIERYLAWLKKQKPFSREDSYKKAVKMIKDLTYSSQDITEFCLRLKKYEQDDDINEFSCTGFYLSALINEHKSNGDFLVVTKHLKEEINWIGYKNIKKITVQGNTGNYTGEEMAGGRLLVEGTSGNETGLRMSGGTIKVEGKVRMYTGEDMTGGIIDIEDGGSWFGHRHGGEIYERGRPVSK